MGAAFRHPAERDVSFVLPRGFEPLTLTGYAPKAYAYASSATGALH